MNVRKIPQVLGSGISQVDYASSIIKSLELFLVVFLTPSLRPLRVTIHTYQSSRSATNGNFLAPLSVRINQQKRRQLGSTL